MKKIKVKIGFSKFSESRFFFKASNIKTCLTDNTRFPAPSPVPPTTNEAFDAYAALLNKRRACTPVEIATKRQLRTDITTVLQGWGAYVQENGDNERTVLLTSGFDLTQEKTPVGPLPAPLDLKVERGLTTGFLNASVKKVKGSYGYFFEIKDASIVGAEWQAAFSTKSKYVFTGLIPGTQYLVRVCAKGSNPTCAYTEAFTVWAS